MAGIRVEKVSKRFGKVEALKGVGAKARGADAHRPAAPWAHLR